jgi:hypothetical protein
MTEYEVFEWPYPSSFAALVVEGVIFIIGGYFAYRVALWLGILLVLVGVGVILLGCIVETRHTIVCTPDGFTVEMKRRLSRTRHTAYAWHDVCRTGYREIMRDAYFVAYTDHGRAFEVRKIARSYFGKGRLDALIDLFNVKTLHLPYTWEWRGPGSTRLWRYGFDRYHRVPRGNAMVSDVPTETGTSRRDRRR